MRRKSAIFSWPVIIIVLIILVIAAYYFIFAKNSPQIPQSDQNPASADQNNPSAAGSATDANGFSYTIRDILAPDGTIHAMLADTAEKMELGLGKRASLAAQNGMLFTFANVDRYEFWMKDMKFPLDIVWIDARKRVVGIERALSPDTYPNTVIAPSAVMYVLEINANEAQKYGIATGTTLRFQ